MTKSRFGKRDVIMRFLHRFNTGHVNYIYVKQRITVSNVKLSVRLERPAIER